MPKKKSEKEQDNPTELAVPKEMKGIGTRITAIAAKVGGKTKLAKMAGISESQLHRLIAEESEGKVGAMSRIANLGGVSLDYLVTGESPEQASQDFEFIPKMVPVEVSTGGGREPSTELTMQDHAFRRDWLVSRGLQTRHLVIITATGDSMEPTIPDGATLLVDTSVTTFHQEGIYVIRLEGHLYAKRLQLGQGGSIQIISDNPLYNPLTVSQTNGDGFQVIGKVVWLGRTI